MKIDVVVDIKMMSLLKELIVTNHGGQGQYIHLTLEVDKIDRYARDMSSIMLVGQGKVFSLLPGMLIGYSEEVKND